MTALFPESTNYARSQTGLQPDNRDAALSAKLFVEDAYFIAVSVLSIATLFFLSVRPSARS